MIARSGGVAATLLLPICLSAHAKERFEHTPPAEQLRASFDSRLIQDVLREPFSDHHDANQSRILILAESGNTQQAQLLKRADDRRLLSAMAGGPYEKPATIGAAIEAENPKDPLGKAIQEALDRVTIDYAPAEAAKAAVVPEGFTQVAPGVWTRTEFDHNVTVRLLVTIRNDLALPLHRAGFSLGQGYSCPVESSDGPGVRMEAGTTTTLVCWARDREERMPEHVKAVAAHALAMPVRPFTLGTEVASIVGGGDSPFLSHGRDDRERQEAWGRLVDAPCADKGSCAEVAQGERERQEETFRKDRPALIVLVLGIMAFVAAAFAASRVRSGGRPGTFRSLCSVAVIAYAALLLSTLYVGVRPDHGNLDLLPALVVYFGGLPFLGLLAIAGTGARRHRLHAFAATLGVALIAIVVVLLAAG